MYAGSTYSLELSMALMGRLFCLDRVIMICKDTTGNFHALLAGSCTTLVILNVTFFVPFFTKVFLQFKRYLTFNFFIHNLSLTWYQSCTMRPIWSQMRPKFVICDYFKNSRRQWRPSISFFSHHH